MSITPRHMSLNSCPTTGLHATIVTDEQEAQLPQRDSASATRVFLGSLTDRAYYNFSVSTPVCRPCAVNPRENSYEPHA